MDHNPSDIKWIRETILSTGEFRVHIKYGRGGANGNTVTARMWHPDGLKVGRATGGGYDMRGSALGDAIELFFQPELMNIVNKGPLGVRARFHPDKKEIQCCSVDGACGVETMLRLLGELGYPARLFETGKDTCMILAERKA